MSGNLRQSEEVISAFLDGEEADLEAVIEALSTPGGWECLVDLLRLRLRIQRETERPPEHLRRRLERRLRRRSRWRRLAAAAALAAVAALAGVWGVRELVGPLRGPGSVPEGIPPTGHVAEEQPPEPDRVIRFSEGVDWYRS